MQSNNLPLFSRNCYKNTFSGSYQTAFGFVASFNSNLVPIHEGICQCEGKTPNECEEPGDPNPQT